VVRPFHTLRELITYAPTKFHENILIGGRDMPQNEIETVPLAAISTSGFNFDKCYLSGTFQ